MKKVTKKWFTIIGIPMVLGLSAAGFTACKGGLHGGHFLMKPDRIQQLLDWKLDDMMDAIDATDTQRIKITALKDRLLDEAVALHRELRDTHGVFLDEWKSVSPDMETIRAQIDENAGKKKAFAGRIADAVVELHGILTPEQRSRITSHIEEHMAQCEAFLTSH